MMRQLKESGGARQAAQLGTWWVLALVWTAAGLIVLGGDLVRILTPQRFHDAAQVIPWLAAGYFALGLYNVLSQPVWLVMRTRLVPVFTAIAAAANIGLNLLLVPRYGMEAAAWNTLIGFAILACLVGRYGQRLHRIPWEYRRWLKLGVAASGVCALGATIGETTVLTVFIKIALLAAGFPLMLGALRFLAPDERRRLQMIPGLGARRRR
jgi:O-antigen/teichoic acid export membrane protein